MKSGNRQALHHIQNITFAELVVFLLIYSVYHSFISNRLLFFGDIGFYDVNSSYLALFNSINPWETILLQFFYIFFPSTYPYLWNILVIFPSMLMPIGMYFLLKKLDFNDLVSTVGSIFYAINPIILGESFSTEYTLPLFLIPLMILLILEYSENYQPKYMIYLAFLTFLYIELNGLVDTKFLILITLPLLIVPIYKSHAKRKFGILRDYSIFLALTLIISLPLILNLYGQFSTYHSAYVSSSALSSRELAIVNYVFHGSNLLSATMGLSLFYGTLSYKLGYNSSLFGLIWLFLIIAGILSSIFYKGKFKAFYVFLIILLFSLIIFQYEVYNKTFLFLYRFSVVDLYNYPLFFNIIQLIIYTIFFALFTQVLFKKTHSFLNHPKLRLSVFRANFSKFFAVIVLIVIIVPSIPILENPGGALNNTPKNVSMPSYVNCMAGFFKDRQNSKVLILPSNVTTLNYLDYMVPYHNVYGFPYDYQVFPSEFPNVSVFSNLTNAFYNSNHSEISTILESQRVGYVVVLNPTQAYPIVPAQTSVNGGGKNFARIMNGTRNYSPLVITENYIIYSFTNLGNYSIPHFSFNYQSLYTNFTKYKAINNVPSVKIVSGNYSHADLPVHINLPAGIAPEPYFTYQQKIFVPINISGYINDNFSNIMFAYSNDTIIPAWIQNISVNGATIWLKLSGEMNRTINLWIFQKSMNVLSAHGLIGEAPQLSGTGATNILPSYIKYSVLGIGVYGYGSYGANFTLNLSFDPKLYSPVENLNLSNLGVFSSSGHELNAFLHKGVTNESSSAILSIEFPGGVNYFRKYGYNVFYLGFASKRMNLNAVYSAVNYTSSPEMSIVLSFQYVRDFGVYGKYDNGKYVFDAYNNFNYPLSNSTLYQANAWNVGVPVAGYGFLEKQTYYPLADVSYILYNITPGETAETYADLSKSQPDPTTSPAFITNYSNSRYFGTGLFGKVSLSSMTNHFSFQDLTQEVGWGTNGTNGSVEGMVNYNYSKQYVFHQSTNSINVSGFNSFGLNYISNGSEQFLLNNSKVGIASVYFNGNTYFGISMIYRGTPLVAFYSFLRRDPTNSRMPSYAFGSLYVAQGTDNGVIIQNPGDVNTDVSLTAFVLNSNLSVSYSWLINGTSYHGQTVNISFPVRGTYEVEVTARLPNAITLQNSINETIVSNPLISINRTPNVTNEYGINTFRAVVINGTGTYSYVWYVNGKAVSTDSNLLSYNFTYPGKYIIFAYVLDSSGALALSNDIVVSIVGDFSFHEKTVYDLPLITYNVLGVPLVVFAVIFRKQISNSKVISIIKKKLF